MNGPMAQHLFVAYYRLSTGRQWSLDAGSMRSAVPHMLTSPATTASSGEIF